MIKILVPTDFSESAGFGIEAASSIAAKTEAELQFLNMVDPPTDQEFSATGDISKKDNSQSDLFTITMIRQNKQRLQNLVNSLPENIKVKTRIMVDYFKGGIEENLQENATDVIIMGTSGENTFEEFIVGNHTEQVIRTFHCPVISLRKPSPSFYPNKVVLALDPDDFHRVPLQKMLDLLAKFGSEVTIFTISSKKSEKQETKLREITSQLDYQKLSTAVHEATKLEDGVSSPVIKLLI